MNTFLAEKKGVARDFLKTSLQTQVPWDNRRRRHQFSPLHHIYQEDF